MGCQPLPWRSSIKEANTLHQRGKLMKWEILGVWNQANQTCDPGKVT